MSNPAPDVLADLLLEAAETGRLMEALDLLSDLAGPALVNAAVGICVDRHRDALERVAGLAAPAAEGPGAPRSGRPAGRGRAAGHRDTRDKAPAERSGTREECSEAAFHLVRRLPDPVTGGRAGRADR